MAALPDDRALALNQSLPHLHSNTQRRYDLMADAQFPLDCPAKLDRIADASRRTSSIMSLAIACFRFRAVVRVRDGFAAIVERVRHSSHEPSGSNAPSAG